VQHELRSVIEPIYRSASHPRVWGNLHGARVCWVQEAIYRATRGWVLAVAHAGYVD